VHPCSHGQTRVYLQAAVHQDSVYYRTRVEAGILLRVCVSSAVCWLDANFHPVSPYTSLTDRIAASRQWRPCGTTLEDTRRGWCVVCVCESVCLAQYVNFLSKYTDYNECWAGVARDIVLYYHWAGGNVRPSDHVDNRMTDRWTVVPLAVAAWTACWPVRLVVGQETWSVSTYHRCRKTLIDVHRTTLRGRHQNHNLRQRMKNREVHTAVWGSIQRNQMCVQSSRCLFSARLSRITGILFYSFYVRVSTMADIVRRSGGPHRRTDAV